MKNGYYFFKKDGSWVKCNLIVYSIRLILGWNVFKLEDVDND